MFKTNRQLRNEMKGMGKQIVDLRGDVGKLTCDLSTMRDKAVRLEQTLIKRDAEVKRVQKQATDLADDLHKQGKIVREQTAADLLLNALESIGIVKNDKPKDYDYLAQANQLQAQQDAIASQVSSYSTSAFARNAGPGEWP